jgi:hypothetical protein
MLWEDKVERMAKLLVLRNGVSLRWSKRARPGEFPTGKRQ